MNKFQNVQFNSVEEFPDFLPEDELRIVKFLRAIIKECIPACKEKLAYNVPYYYRHSRICFIWPASIPWGKVEKHGVMLGFTNGYFNVMRLIIWIKETESKSIAKPSSILKKLILTS